MKFLALLVLLLISISSYSQRFQGGAMGGLCGAQVDGDTYSGFNRLGPQGGAWVRTRFVNNFGSQMEIRYISKGARENRHEPEPLFYKVNLHYVEVPILLNYYINDDIIAELGIAPAILMAMSQEDENGKIPENSLDQEFKNFDFGGSVGINYQFTDRLIGNMRYTYSLITIQNRVYNSDYYYSFLAKALGYDQGSYNNVLTLSVYYVIGK